VKEKFSSEERANQRTWSTCTLLDVGPPSQAINDTVSGIGERRGCNFLGVARPAKPFGKGSVHGKRSGVSGRRASASAGVCRGGRPSARSVDRGAGGRGLARNGLEVTATLARKGAVG